MINHTRGWHRVRTKGLVVHLIPTPPDLGLLLDETLCLLRGLDAFLLQIQRMDVG